MEISFKNAAALHKAAESLVDENVAGRYHETVHHEIYERFSAALNEFGKAQDANDLTEDPQAVRFAKPFRNLRRSYISVPLPMKQLVKVFGFKIQPPSLPACISSEGIHLAACYRALEEEKTHPYEDSISAAVGPHYPDDLVIRIVLKSWYLSHSTQKVEDRLREYENLNSDSKRIEIVAPRVAATANEAADLQIVLGNLDYLESPPFERYRSISSARASRLHLISLAPHSHCDSFSSYMRVLKKDEPMKADFEAIENMSSPDGNEINIVFPQISVEDRLMREGSNNGVRYRSVFEGPEGSISTTNQHVTRLSVDLAPGSIQIISAESCDLEELEIGDIIALQTKGLRGDELSESLSSEENYQKVRKLATDWKERLHNGEYAHTAVTLNRIKHCGGELLASLNESHLKRWRNRESISGPGDEKIFNCLLTVLGYEPAEVRKIIEAKSKLNNHHRQLGKSASRAMAKELQGKKVTGDLSRNHLNISVTVSGAALEMVILKILDIDTEISE